MGILSNKLLIGLIVLVVLTVFIMIGFYFGVRWASQDVLGFDIQPDRLTVDLKEKRMELEEWSNDFLNEFPDTPAVKATIQTYQEILSQVIDRNEQLRQEGMSSRSRIKHLTQFAKEVSGPIAEQTRSTELHLELMHKDGALKEQIDRYIHADWILPLPIYLLGLNEKEMLTLQEQLQASQNGHQ